ncbi:type II/IV secretion system protein [Lujinxingia vulgaris]|uniref:Type II/IV secretion system protein n=1 Tax=Lujinxingia vulgaris TaxID=2600176 RepID=A0A5C6X3L1_9DELT|nr:GspE/PulE family protein [Lujinxingia vulgaris]TXD31762.1 type II/IV secretion system protein [Lujinxingia vulgaris]
MVGPTSVVDYSVRHLSQALMAQGLLNQEQARRAVEQEAVVRHGLLKAKADQAGRRRASYKVTPAEVIAQLEFRQPSGDLLDEDAIMAALARDAGLPFEKPDPLELDMELIARTMSQPFARRHSCVALRREEGRTIIAVDNPYDRQLLHELHTLIPGELSIVVSPKSDILRIVTEVYGLRSSISAAQEELSIGIDIGNLEQLIRLKDVGDIEATDRPIVNAVEYLLHYAFDQRASDIHLEPKRDRTVVRLRIDGVLHGVYEFPRAIHAALISRVKMLARMDIAEKRRPQDGRIKTERAGREVELRVSTLPVAFGEKAVIRVFDPQALIQNLDHIGFYKDDLTRWRNFINRPHGLILVTGPTGSGKTTTLYSTLRELAGPDVNITTVEDPIEMVYEEFNQVLVQRRIDVDFSTALRTILRQDPDIIMVGEIRDGETASMATQAALTGHLVFSTLHTNDTPSAINRLIDMEVEPFLMASTMVGVMAQRLLRTICPRCKVQGTLSAEQVELLQIKLPPRSSQSLPMWYGEGCVKCRGTGYFGRTAIFELLPVDETVRQLIAKRASAPEIRKAARANGMMSLRECAIKKLAQGLTTFEEVMTVVSDVT